MCQALLWVPHSPCTGTMTTVSGAAAWQEAVLDRIRPLVRAGEVQRRRAVAVTERFRAARFHSVLVLLDHQHQVHIANSGKSQPACILKTLESVQIITLLLIFTIPKPAAINSCMPLRDESHFPIKHENPGLGEGGRRRRILWLWATFTGSISLIPVTERSPWQSSSSQAF